MSLSDYKFKESDFRQKSIADLSDTPSSDGMTSADLKAYFDFIPKTMIALGAINNIIDLLTSSQGSSNLGGSVTGVTGTTIQEILNGIKVLIDDRYTKETTMELLGYKASKVEVEWHIKNVEFDSKTGMFTFTRHNNQTFTIDTALEKLAVNFDYDEEGQALILNLADGTTQSIALSSFVTVNEIVSSDNIIATVKDGVISLSIKDGSITDEMLSSTIMETLRELVLSAKLYADNAEAAKNNAGTYESSALESKNAAEKAANEAKTAKNDALNYLQQSMNQATAAGQHANDALTYKNLALAAKDKALGAVIKTASIDKNGELIITYESGGTVNAGKTKGEDGFSPEVLIERNDNDTRGSVVIIVTNKDGSPVSKIVYDGKEGPPGPAGSDATVTTENIKKALGYTPADTEKVNQLSEEIDNQQEQLNNKQPKGNYLTEVPDGYVTDAELQAEVAAREQAVADLNARLGQQTVLIAEGETQEDAEAWLESNADKTKVYLMPDNTFWQYKEVTEVVEGGVAYTNLLPTAKDTDRTTIYEGVGFKKDYRLSSSGGVSAQTGMRASGFFVGVKENDILRIKGINGMTGVSSYVISYNSSNTKVAAPTVPQNGANFQTPPSTQTQYGYMTYDATEKLLTVTLGSGLFGTGFDAVRFSGVFDENTIVTINEEIKEGGGTTTVIVEKWVTTGHGLIATNYDAIISTINSTLTAHTKEIAELRELVESGQTGTDVDPLDLIRNWDAPIYDANIPVFALETEKTAKTNATNTPDAIYAMYDALMAKYPKYITKTDLGVCSDGVNHVYRYDFREPEPYHQSNMPWSETKTKAIIVSGIHYEWAGIYSLYYALEEITENPKLFNLRRNTHFIVIPVLNPYCTITANYNASIGVLNANGVQIHRNFEVGFIYPGESGYVEFGERNHGGTEPLSEMETQCLDNIFKENTDAAFFLTCHNFDSPSATNGLGFIWPSAATMYMCNMGYRLIDKMTKLWLDKYSEELEAGIADYRTDNVSDDFIRFGHAHVSLTDGTETRQATKYGIQGNNVEVCMRFYPHGTTDNVEPALSEFTLSRGAETYINFLLTACGTYDYKDKALYTV